MSIRKRTFAGLTRAPLAQGDAMQFADAIEHAVCVNPPAIAGVVTTL